MGSQKDDFSLKNYTRCIEKSLSLGYEFITLGEYFLKKYSKEKRQIILRHDVDTQLDVACKMAEIEKEAGVSSTYFFRFHSHSYNPMCLRDHGKILKIRDLNHEIGLHYESDFYYMVGKDTNEAIGKECDMLSYITGCDIATICPHEPTRTGKFHVENCQYNQAYDKKLLERFKYISDSSCRWRDGSFYENINKDHSHLYILTHPYWWYNITPIENY